MFPVIQSKCTSIPRGIPDMERIIDLIIIYYFAYTTNMKNKTYYGKMKRRGLKIATGAGRTLSSPATDPGGRYTGVVTDPNYSVPEQDADDL